MKSTMLALAAALAGTALGATAAPRGFTVEDLVTMERVGSPAVAPDGNRVGYTVPTTDKGKSRDKIAGFVNYFCADCIEGLHAEYLEKFRDGGPAAPRRDLSGHVSRN